MRLVYTTSTYLPVPVLSTFSVFSIYSLSLPVVSYTCHSFCSLPTLFCITFLFLLLLHSAFSVTGLVLPPSDSVTGQRGGRFLLTAASGRKGRRKGKGRDKERKEKKRKEKQNVFYSVPPSLQHMVLLSLFSTYCCISPKVPFSTLCCTALLFCWRSLFSFSPVLVAVDILVRLVTDRRTGVAG